MNEPWFPPQYAWILGAGVGVMGGVLGTLMGVCGPAGKAKSLVFGLYWGSLLISVACLLTGIAALIAGQPYGVWYGLTLAGFIGSLVLGLNYFTLVNVYRQAEQRKMAAQNL